MYLPALLNIKLFQYANTIKVMLSKPTSFFHKSPITVMLLKHYLIKSSYFNFQILNQVCARYSKCKLLVNSRQAIHVHQFFQILYRFFRCLFITISPLLYFHSNPYFFLLHVSQSISKVQYTFLFLFFL